MLGTNHENHFGRPRSKSVPLELDLTKVDPTKVASTNHATLFNPRGETPTDPRPPKKKLHLVDYDGTVTCTPDKLPTDMWRAITRHFIPDQFLKKFDKAIEEWKQYMKLSEKKHLYTWRLSEKSYEERIEINRTEEFFDARHLRTSRHPRIEYSHDMMAFGLTLMPNDTSEEKIREHAKTVTLEYIQNGTAKKSAFDYISKLIKQEETVIISTGGYETGIHGAIDAYIEASWLPESAREKILVSGAKVTWSARRLTHANVEENKIVGLEEILGPYPNIIPQLVAVYVDSPEGGDKGLCELAKRADAPIHIFETSKNQDKGHKYSTFDDLLEQLNSSFLHELNPPAILRPS